MLTYATSTPFGSQRPQQNRTLARWEQGRIAFNGLGLDNDP
jgi:hypothetical protein